MRHLNFASGYCSFPVRRFRVFSWILSNHCDIIKCCSDVNLLVVVDLSSLLLFPIPIYHCPSVARPEEETRKAARQHVISRGAESIVGSSDLAHYLL